MGAKGKRRQNHSADQKAAMRADWESGLSCAQVARKHGCCVSVVQKRKAAEGWTRPDGTIPERQDISAMSTRMELFVAEYLKDFDADAAALRVGYKNSRSGHNLLKRPDVRELLNEAISTYHTHAAALKMRLLQEDVNRVFFDPKEFLDYSASGVVLKPLQELPRKVRALIKNVKEVRQKDGTITVEVELYDKDRSADRLYKHLGLLNDKIEHSVSTPLAELLAEIAARGPMPVRGGRTQEESA